MDLAIDQEDISLLEKTVRECQTLQATVKNPYRELILRHYELKYHILAGHSSRAYISYLYLDSLVQSLTPRDEFVDIHLSLYRYSITRDDAVASLRHYTDYQDLLQAADQRKMLNSLENLRAKYDISERDRSILRLERDKTSLALKNSSQLLWIIGLSALVIFLLGSAYVYQQFQRLRRSRVEAELKERVLRSQFDPHFTFNVLGSIQNTILSKDTDLANEYLVKFSQLLRSSLSYSDQKTISLEEEMAFMRKYMEIEKDIRGQQFDYQVELLSSTADGSPQIHPLLVQPLVENSIKHAFSPDDSGMISLQYRVDAQTRIIHCALSDNGSGFKHIDIDKSKSKGLQLVLDRIEMLRHETGREEYKVRWESDETGSRFHLTIPYL